MARGDHLFIYCLGYSHHGIDCGDGSVVHFDSDPWRKITGTVRSERAPRICRVSSEEFSGGRPVQVRPYEYADDAETVFARANDRVGEVGYHVFGNNCEHFAVWCKTGKHQSTQVDSIRAAMKPMGRTLATSALILRRARRLPPRLRLVAYGAAFSLTTGTFALRYMQQRFQNFARGES